MPAGILASCCVGAEIVGIVDGVGWGDCSKSMNGVFAELEALDCKVSVVEMGSVDLSSVILWKPEALDYDQEGWMLWGAKVKVIDFCLVIWDEKKGRK